MFGEEQPCVGVFVSVCVRDARCWDGPDYDVDGIYTRGWGKQAICCPLSQVKA